VAPVIDLPLKGPVTLQTAAREVRNLVANDAFFQRPQAAAALKHGVLKRYAPVFATMAGTRTAYVNLQQSVPPGLPSWPTSTR
jgi:hypothetical protein